MFKKQCPAFVILLMAMTVVASAQTKPRPAPRRQSPVGKTASIRVDEATDLTNGWARLAEGNVTEALAVGVRLLSRSPRSPAALSLTVEAEIARAGAAAGLDRYERWLNGRALDEPGIVRRIATATLWEAARGQGELATRLAALQALQEDGDPQAAAERAKLASTAGPGTGTRTLASAGDETAVRKLIVEMKQGMTNEVQAIGALGESGSKLAIPAIVERLSDPRQEVRGAAVTALGAIGDPEVLPRLTPMLSDRSVFVRARAAASMLKLGDDAPWPMLQQMSLDESASVRLLAAESMASRPDASWLTLVHQLLEDPDPEIRANAARLLAPHEPELARAALDTLATDENSAIRELAGASQAEALPNDLGALRGLLGSRAAGTRVQAAARILALTR